MMIPFNEDIKEYMTLYHVKAYQVAMELGMSEDTFMCWLNSHGMSNKLKDAVFMAINKLKK